MNNVANNRQTERVSLGSGVRNLNWFLQTFDQYIVSMESYIGRPLVLDEEQLRQVYFDWIVLFESQAIEEYSKTEYWDCVDYVAGMGLKGLIVKNPLSTGTDEFVGRQRDPVKLARVFGLNITEVEDLPAIIKFWPEGFLYVCFCISFINRLRRQKKMPPKKLDNASFKLKSHWWSFRENALEDTNTVLFFFDTMLGNKPADVSDSLYIRQLKSQDSVFKLDTEEPDDK